MRCALRYSVASCCRPAGRRGGVAVQ